MKGLGQKLIALLVAAALFVALAVPALAAHTPAGDVSQDQASAGLAAAGDPDTNVGDITTADDGNLNGLDP